MTKFLTIAGVIGLLSVGTGWVAIRAAETSRSDCPGKIVCPLTGDQVCADRCPVKGADESASSLAAIEPLSGDSCCPLPPAQQPKPNKPKPDKPKGEGDE